MNDHPEPTDEAQRPEVILVVDDTPANLKLLTQLLSARGYRVHVAPNGPMALRSVRESPPDLVLLDLLMPGMDGFEVCRRLKADHASRDIPVLFLSAVDGAESKIRAFDAGGVDYVTKPFQEVEVLARVATHLRMRRMQRLLEEKNRALERLATTDPLTGLLNRRSFEARAGHALHQALRYDTPCCLVLFDIDHFKQVNDRLGHAIGDQVLCAVTERIQARLRRSDLFGRWGGEEFTLLLPHTGREAGLQLAEHLRERLADPPIATSGPVTASFGVAWCLPDDELEQLLKRADLALYAAKQAGRNRVVPASGAVLSGEPRQEQDGSSFTSE